MRGRMQVVGGALLVVSGVLSYLAAAQRWWPACRMGDFDAPACLRVQDHLYDVSPAFEPWEPIGRAAELAGASVLVLAAALVPVVLALCGGRLTARFGTLAGVAALALVPIGVQDIWSGRAGEVAHVPGIAPASFVWAIGLPVLVILAAVLSPSRGARARRAAAVLIALSTPLALYFVASFLLVGYVSYDTPPWSEGVAGILVALAGVVLLLAPRPDPDGDTEATRAEPSRKRPAGSRSSR